MSLYDIAVPIPAGFRDVSVEQVANLSPGSATRLIDVRETDEWLGDLGHAETALHVPLATVAQAAAT